jgi:predicted NBD/HSP70 family sugar kinase
MKTVTLVSDIPGGFVYIDIDEKALKFHRTTLKRDIVLTASRPEDAADLAEAIADMVAVAKAKK